MRSFEPRQGWGLSEAVALEHLRVLPTVHVLHPLQIAGLVPI